MVPAGIRNTKSAPPGGFQSLLQSGLSEVAAKAIPLIARRSPGRLVTVN